VLSNSIQSGYVAVILQAEGRRYIRLAQDVALLPFSWKVRNL